MVIVKLCSSFHAHNARDNLSGRFYWPAGNDLVTEFRAPFSHQNSAEACITIIGARIEFQEHGIP
jgi:hypothetical protein